MGARVGTAEGRWLGRPRPSSSQPDEQRVAIARVLASRPWLVLDDEPTANLDTADDQQAMEIMQRVNDETGTAFIFATHDPRVVSFARRVVKMRDGRLIDDGLGNQRLSLSEFIRGAAS